MKLLYLVNREDLWRFDSKERLLLVYALCQFALSPAVAGVLRGKTKCCVSGPLTLCKLLEIWRQKAWVTCWCHWGVHVAFWTSGGGGGGCSWVQFVYRGADKSLARPTSRCIFLMVRIFRLMLVLLYIYIYMCVCVCVCVCVYVYIYIYIHIHIKVVQIWPGLICV
jgi:hypothetical protein